MVAVAPVSGAQNVTAAQLVANPQWVFPLLGPTRASQVSYAALATALGDTSNFPVITALNTVGAGTITAAGIVGQVTTRGGTQIAAFTDTTDTAANIVAAVPNAQALQSFYYTYRNNTSFPATIAGGSGVTAAAIVPKNSWARFLVTLDTLAAVSMVLIDAGPTVSIPNAQFSTAALESATIAAASVAGANVVEHINTGTTPANLQFPAATDVVAAIPGAQIGFSYILEIRNGSGSANTATITTNTGVTLTGTMTIAQNVTRRFIVTLDSLTAITVQSMGISAAGA